MNLSPPAPVLVDHPLNHRRDLVRYTGNGNIPAAANRPEGWFERFPAAGMPDPGAEDGGGVHQFLYPLAGWG